MNPQSLERVTIERLDSRGDGVASVGERPVRVPYTVPGDVVDASVDGERGALRAVLSPSPDRVLPFCPYFTRCGGCATQSVALPLQLAWKRALVVSALTRAGVEAPVDPCIDAHGAGRRRATFHARRGADGRTRVGFMAARSHDLVAIEACPLFAPEMVDAVEAAQAIATVLSATGKPLDIAVTATAAGLDVDVRGAGPLPDGLARALVARAERAGLARLSNHGRDVVTFRQPTVFVGDTRVALPAGAFLQATEAGERALATCVLDATSGAKRVADLFGGIGTFALRLAKTAAIHAVETDRKALDACLAASRETGHAGAVTGETRDLVRRPLGPGELAPFDAVVFDPPRAGAAEQARELARSVVPVVVAVSCNAQSFARDAKILVDGGYRLERVTPLDQFRHSPHVELVGVLRRAKAKRTRRRLG